MKPEAIIYFGPFVIALVIVGIHIAHQPDDAMDMFAGPAGRAWCAFLIAVFWPLVVIYGAFWAVGKLLMHDGDTEAGR